jgi:peroxiredoxin (alkyl hydroperoxide reductase subunit C)
MNLVTKAAPDFSASAIMPDNKINDSFVLSRYRENDMVLLFFYPLDFTFVCPSEIIAFNHRVAEFEQKKVKLIGVSVDSHFTHLAWKKTPINKGGIGNINFPLVADLTKSISESYGVLLKEGIALRGTFLIDTRGIVRHALVNDLPLGRNVDETLRTIDALIHHEQYGDVCPAGWKKGKEAMKATPNGVEEYLTKNAEQL